MEFTKAEKEATKVAINGFFQQWNNATMNPAPHIKEQLRILGDVLKKLA